MSLKFFQYTDENGEVVLTQVSNITNIRSKKSQTVVETIDGRETILNTGIMRFLSIIRQSRNVSTILEIETS
jgi:hypothetical protein